MFRWGRAAGSEVGARRRGSRAIALVVTVALACAPHAEVPDPDPLLLESVEWYLGTGGRVDDVRARRLLEQAVTEGDALSRMWLARVHSTGRMGFPRDSLYARELASEVVEEVARRAAAEQVEAVFLMGTAWDEGLGRPIDADSAVVWYRRAAESGHVLAQHNLGNALAAGRGVTAPDPAEAAMWWERAALQGDAIPALRLGEAYEHGVGVERDLERARRWYADAAARGNEAAALALERLANEP